MADRDQTDATIEQPSGAALPRNKNPKIFLLVIAVIVLVAVTVAVTILIHLNHPAPESPNPTEQSTPDTPDWWDNYMEQARQIDDLVIAGDFTAAMAIIDSQITEAEQIGSPDLLFRAKTTKAIILANQSQYRPALDIWEELLQNNLPDTDKYTTLANIIATYQELKDAANIKKYTEEIVKLPEHAAFYDELLKEQP